MIERLLLGLLADAQLLVEGVEGLAKTQTIKSLTSMYGGPSITLPVDSGIRYQTTDPRLELLGMMKARLPPGLTTGFELDRALPALGAPLRELGQLRGASLQWLPKDAALVVEAPGAAPATSARSATRGMRRCRT